MPDLRKIITLLPFALLPGKYAITQVVIDCASFTAGPSYTYTYAQAFDTLTHIGATASWTDNSTIPGWYLATTINASISSYSIGSGTNSNGAFYSYGSVGSSERALGSLGSNTFSGTSGSGCNYIGLLFYNGTSETITLSTISYTGEEWRDGGTGGAQDLTLQYLVSAGSITLPGTGFSDLPGLTFSSPTYTTTAGSLNGNSASNRTALSATESIDIPSDSYLMLRWKDLNDPASPGDNAQAIDDFSTLFLGGDPCYTLPVTINDWKAEVQGHAVSLSWNTMSEEQNAYFLIQKSENGLHFFDIAKIPGAGNSSNFLSYSYLDDAPFAGINYYRLLSVDYSGDSTASDVVYAVMQNDLYHLQIFPNPVAGAFSIATLPSIETPFTVRIINIRGETVFQDAQYHPGEILHPGLPPGYYGITVSGGGFVFSSQFIEE